MIKRIEYKVISERTLQPEELEELGDNGWCLATFINTDGFVQWVFMREKLPADQ